MSIRKLRDALVREKEAEKASHMESHTSHLKLLYKVTNLLANAENLPLVSRQLVDEVWFLKENDLSRNLLFRDDSLPSLQYTDGSQAISLQQQSHLSSHLSTNDFVNSKTSTPPHSKSSSLTMKHDHLPQRTNIPITHTPPRSPLHSQTSEPSKDHTQHSHIISPSSPSSGIIYTNSSKQYAPSPNTSPDTAASPASYPDGSSVGKVESTPESQLKLEEAQANEAASRPNGPSSTASKSAIEQSSMLVKSKPSLKALSTKDVDKNDSPNKTDTPMPPPELPSTPATPATPATPSSSRMTTRVASGAIRQKSVSEILGEIPKGSPQTSQREVKNDDRRPVSRKSTVVFSKDKDVASQAQRNELDGYLALKGASLDPEKDYLKPLFLYQAYAPPRGNALNDLVSHTRKAVTTNDMIMTMRESLDQRILRKIYQLQNANKWSLRQPMKYPDPTPRTHWDMMLEEVKWMRTDFREERKWKRSLARNLAQWCAEYINASNDERNVLRIKTKIPSPKVINDSFDDLPELSEAETSEVSEDDMATPLAVFNPPHALFSLGFEDILFKYDDTPAARALLGELPTYDANSENEPIDPAIPLTRHENMLPVSKFVTGKIVPKISGPPKKRSRYEYEEADEEIGGLSHKRARSSSSVTPFLSPARRSIPKTELPPEDSHVALFSPLNKQTLQRIRTTNSFRPPSEFPMPSEHFYVNRIQSKWTWDEDQRLRHCVRQYNYNWSMIAGDLESKFQPSKFRSGPERRTPWECFERWTQLEGLPNDLGRSVYFKAYQQRIETATKQATEKQNITANQPPPTTTIRYKGLPPEKTTQRRDSRHIHLVDAMRRLARRRENNILRQQEAAKAAALRKSHHDQNSNRPAIKKMTPQEWSQEKFGREYKRQLTMQTEMQQSSEINRQQFAANGVKTAAVAAAVATNSLTPQQQQAYVAAHRRAVQQQAARVGMQAGVGQAAANQLGANGLTQAQQIQAFQRLQQAGQLNPQLNLNAARLAQQRQHLQQQMSQQQLGQQQMGQQQMGQLPSQTANLVAAHLSPSGGLPSAHQQQLLQAIQRANHANSNGFNGMNSSPTSAANNFISAKFNAVMQALQHSYPSLPIEQLRQVATEHVRQQMGREALASAAGGSPLNNQQNLASSHFGVNGQPTPQMMSALAHAQQQQQQQQQQQSQTGQTTLGPMASPAQGLAAVMAAQQQQQQQSQSPTNAVSPNPGASINSPTQQMYRGNVAAAAAVSRLGSGSPGILPARPDSRGSNAAMVRSASGMSGISGMSAQGSPVLNAGAFAR